MIKEKLQKAKNYVVEHKTVFISLGAGAIAAVGCALGWTACMKRCGLKPGDVVVTDERIGKLLLDSVDKYNKTGCRCHILTSDEPIKVEALGELGKHMTAVGSKATDGFTHFLAFGERSE